MPVAFERQLGADMYTGVRMTYERNVPYSNARRTQEENIEVAKQALALLLDIEQEILFGIPRGET